MTRTIDDVLHSVPSHPGFDPLPKPEYADNIGPFGCLTGLAVESMKRHMTDEGYQLFQGLESAGYFVYWSGLDTAELLDRRPEPMMTTLVLQDKREWEGLTADRSRDPAMRFTHVEALRDRADIFKGTILKDSQHQQAYHRQSADEIGAHFWIVYYHPRIVAHLAPYVRPEHLIRTYHSLDKDLVPKFNLPTHRGGCILSGALSRAYPLRTRLYKTDGPWERLPHPGYHRNGCATPTYLRILNNYKVAICTSSMYGYAVRKIMEATACGCSVITDLPAGDVLPGIDGNLTRVSPDATVGQIANMVNALISGYDPYQQEKYAEIAKHLYDYRVQGQKLADDIESLRRSYNANAG